MAIKVLGIAPYPGLRDLLLDMADKDKEIEIDVEVADLGEAVPLLKRVREQKYDVIISRGGTASLIKKHVEIPVIDVPVSGYDILRVLTLIKDSNSQVAIVGFPNICQGAATVSSLLDFEIPIYSIEHESEVTRALKRAINNGVQIVLGDVVTVKNAENMGYHGILITSGQESVLEALSDVKRVYEVYLKGQKQAQFFETLLNQDSRGIIVTGNDARIQYINKAAADLFDAAPKQAEGQNLANFSKELQMKYEEMQQQTVSSLIDCIVFRDKQLGIQAVKLTENETVLEEAGVLFYLDVLKGRQMGATAVPVRTASFSQIIGNSIPLQQAVKKAKGFAKTQKHIWISGEPGSGRSLFAQAIHSASARHSLAFYNYSCLTKSIKQLGVALFGTEEAPGVLFLPSTGTVYLEEVERMPVELQERLIEALREGVQAQLIVSSVHPWTYVVKNTNFISELANELAELQLKIPPLRERTEDIEETARVLIASHNSQFGKHIVGIREEVLEMLEAHDWPGNFKEFENVLEEMLMLTNGHYVDKEQGDAVWEMYQTDSRQGAGKHDLSLDISGTWEDIERRLLLQILQEEGMNQSKAAKRLGINRSTLWRKLHDVLQN